MVCQIMFSSPLSTTGALALVLALPSNAQSGWSAPVLVPNIGSAISDTSPGLSADGLTMYFASSRSGDWEIYQTTRPAAGQAWNTPTVVAATSVQAAARTVVGGGAGWAYYVDNALTPPAYTFYANTDTVTPSEKDF